MDEKSLDELLRQRREAAGSSLLPPNFKQNVWREIRLRSASESSGLGKFTGWHWLLRPQFVTALLVLALLVGIGLGSRQADPLALSTKQALNLDVFGATAPALPSTLLSSNL
jgi:hypothetical protein